MKQRKLLDGETSNYLLRSMTHPKTTFLFNMRIFSTFFSPFHFCVLQKQETAYQLTHTFSIHRCLYIQMMAFTFDCIFIFCSKTKFFFLFVEIKVLILLNYFFYFSFFLSLFYKSGNCCWILCQGLAHWL